MDAQKDEWMDGQTNGCVHCDIIHTYVDGRVGNRLIDGWKEIWIGKKKKWMHRRMS